MKNRFETKNQVIKTLKNYFDPSTKAPTNLDPQNSLQLLKQAIFGNFDYKLMQEQQCDQCVEKDKMTENLELIAQRYIHMNTFNYKLFNIHLVINGESSFYTFDTSTSKLIYKLIIINKILSFLKKKNFFIHLELAIKKEKIENDTIHFTVNSKSMEHFQMFVDHNDASGIELTTKLF